VAHTASNEVSHLAEKVEGSLASVPEMVGVRAEDSQEESSESTAEETPKVRQAHKSKSHKKKKEEG
jgi:hypothetical protein